MIACSHRFISYNRFIAIILIPPISVPSCSATAAPMAAIMAPSEVGDKVAAFGEAERTDATPVPWTDAEERNIFAFPEDIPPGTDTSFSPLNPFRILPIRVVRTTRQIKPKNTVPRPIKTTKTAGYSILLGHRCLSPNTVSPFMQFYKPSFSNHSQKIYNAQPLETTTCTL